MLFSKILVAYDGSNLSKKALDTAVELIQESNGIRSPILEVIHVFQYPSVLGNAYIVDSKDEYLEYAQAAIDGAKEFIPSSLIVKYVLLNGQPAHSILNYANENNSDLIVMGSRGLGTIREFFLGSVSHNIVQNSKIPVLIVK